MPGTCGAFDVLVPEHQDGAQQLGWRRLPSAPLSRGALRRTGKRAGFCWSLGTGTTSQWAKSTRI